MKNSIYIFANSEKEYNDTIVSAVLSPWYFRFPGVPWPHYNDAKKQFHGNSKILLHLFYNSITGAHEISVTTAATEKTYPHIKTIKAEKLDNMNYEKMLSIFGDPHKKERGI